MSNCNKIRRIVRIQQMLKRWRRKARMAAAFARAGSAAPSDVPAGHVAVCVGESCRRYIVLAKHLNHPIFKRLLVQAEEEYGFTNAGPLAIPCEESTFEEILRVVSRSGSTNSGRFLNLEDLPRFCHVDAKNKLGEFLIESRPLLHN